MARTTCLAAVVLTVTLGFGSSPVAAHSAQETPSAYRSTVDLLMIEVQVTPPNGKPQAVLTAGDFQVQIGRKKRRVVIAEFLHSDDGPVVRGAPPPRMDQQPRPPCVFQFSRTSEHAHAHYLLGLEPEEADKREVTKPQIKVVAGGFQLRRWAWRSRR